MVISHVNIGRYSDTAGLGLDVVGVNTNQKTGKVRNISFIPVYYSNDNYCYDYYSSSNYDSFNGVK